LIPPGLIFFNHSPLRESTKPCRIKQHFENRA
jgi:hypothetical protein